jgi:hypothetical protein
MILVKGGSQFFIRVAAAQGDRDTQQEVPEGDPSDDVSMLLAHKSIKITESYYSHWIKARRERLEERVRELWT